MGHARMRAAAFVLLLAACAARSLVYPEPRAPVQAAVGSARRLTQVPGGPDCLH